MTTKFSGADWLKDVTKKEMAPFGELVADILGQAYGGIYHIEDEVLHKRAEWSHPYRIEICVYGELSTYDFNMLTKLVVLCHDSAVRFTVAPASLNYLRLLFYKRERDSEHVSQRHPTLEAQAATIRADIGLPACEIRDNEASTESVSLP